MPKDERLGDRRTQVRTKVFFKMRYLNVMWYLSSFLIHSVQRKLESFRREVFTACSKGSLPRTHGSLAELRKTFHPRTNFHSLRSQLKSSMVRTGIKKKLKEKQRKSSLSGLSKSQRQLKDKERSRTADEVIPQSSHCDRRDDIDDIFASIGL